MLLLPPRQPGTDAHWLLHRLGEQQSAYATESSTSYPSGAGACFHAEGVVRQGAEPTIAFVAKQAPAPALDAVQVLAATRFVS